MKEQVHWEELYRTKAESELSWSTPHLLTSVSLIEEAAPKASAAIIDVGGGQSTLVDDLLDHGYRDVTVLDVSPAALERSRHRLGHRSSGVNWIAGDILDAGVPPRSYDVWHDRAVFHFMTAPEQRSAYIQHLRCALRCGGHFVIGSFALDGPPECSGLPVMRYDEAMLQTELGPGFELVSSTRESHVTPFGTRQEFLYCDFLFAQE